MNEAKGIWGFQAHNKAGWDSYCRIQDIRGVPSSGLILPVPIFPHVYFYEDTDTQPTYPEIRYHVKDWVAYHRTWNGSVWSPAGIADGYGLYPGQRFWWALSLSYAGFPIATQTGHVEVRLGDGDVRTMAVAYVNGGDPACLGVCNPCHPSRSITHGFTVFNSEFILGWLYPNIDDYPNTKFQIVANDAWDGYGYGSSPFQIWVTSGVNLNLYTQQGKTARIIPAGKASDIIVSPEWGNADDPARITWRGTPMLRAGG